MRMLLVLIGFALPGFAGEPPVPAPDVIDVQIQSNSGVHFNRKTGDVTIDKDAKVREVVVSLIHDLVACQARLAPPAPKPVEKKK